MKFYKNINELVESLTKDIITDKYEIEEFDDSYINQLEAIYNSSYFKPCKKAIIDQFISLLNDEDNIKNLLLPKILIDKNINIIYNGVFKEQNHDYEDLLTYGLYHHGYTLDFMYLSNKKSIINKFYFIYNTRLCIIIYICYCKTIYAYFNFRTICNNYVAMFFTNY